MSNFFDDLPELSTQSAGGNGEYNSGSSWVKIVKEDSNTAAAVNTNSNNNDKMPDSTNTSISSESNGNKNSLMVPITLKKQEKPSLTPFAFKPRQTKINSSANNNNQKSNLIETVSSTIVTKSSSSSSSSSSKFSSLKEAEDLKSEDFKDIHNNNNNENNYNHYINKIIDSISTFDVFDPYDPTKPNDYLKFREEVIAKKRALILEEEYQQQLLEAQKVREAKEKERADAVEQGDIQKLQELSSVGRGRGRGGRGISNLPAWMTEKSKDFSNNDNDNNNDNNNDNISIKHEGQFDDVNNYNNVNSNNTKKRKFGTIPTTILLLENMVSILEVDDSLQDEVKQECSKYGTVLSCVIHTINDDVRIFVEFENQSSSVLAFKNMNNRYFGGKRIDASFYDENDFKNRKLSS